MSWLKEITADGRKKTEVNDSVDGRESTDGEMEGKSSEGIQTNYAGQIQKTKNPLAIE